MPEPIMRMLVWDQSEATPEFLARMLREGWAPDPGNVTRLRADGCIDWLFHWVGPGEPPAA